MQMTYLDFLEKLAHQQLKNTSAVDDAQLGTVVPKYEEQLLELTNQGLSDIHTRMKLRENRTILNLIPNQNEYPLTASPDFDDLIKVLKIEAVRKGDEVLEKNKRTFIPKTNMHIEMPNNYTLRFSDTFLKTYGSAIDIVYHANHPVIDITDTIDIPRNMYEPLALYVAGLFLSHMGGESHTAKGDSYYGLYLKMLTDDVIENRSGTSEVTDNDTRFSDRGFV